MLTQKESPMLKLAVQEPGLEVWGVDNNGMLLDQVLRKAADRELTNLRLVVEDAKHLSFPDDTFDKVVCVNLFLNIGFDAMTAVLKEMKRVCTRQGRLIFEFRNSRNLLDGKGLRPCHGSYFAALSFAMPSASIQSALLIFTF